jgi:hypothetical protein
MMRRTARPIASSHIRPAPSPDQIPDVVAAEGEEVSYTWGSETLCPVRYNACTVGPFTVTTRVRKGESAAQALARARDELAPFVAEELDRKVREHYEVALDLKTKFGR